MRACAHVREVACMRACKRVSVRAHVQAYMRACCGARARAPWHGRECEEVVAAAQCGELDGAHCREPAAPWRGVVWRGVAWRGVAWRARAHVRAGEGGDQLARRAASRRPADCRHETPTTSLAAAKPKHRPHMICREKKSSAPLITNMLIRLVTTDD